MLLTMNSCSNALIVCVFRFTRVQRRMQRSAHIILGSPSSTKGKKPAAVETLFGSMTQSVTILICCTLKIGTQFLYLLKILQYKQGLFL